MDNHPTPAIELILEGRGYSLPDNLRERWWNGDLDGIEHLDESRSRDHYVAWQEARLVDLLTEADVHPGEHDVIVAELRAGREHRDLRAYAEVPEVLRRQGEVTQQLAVDDLEQARGGQGEQPVDVDA